MGYYLVLEAAVCQNRRRSGISRHNSSDFGFLPGLGSAFKWLSDKQAGSPSNDAYWAVHHRGISSGLYSDHFND